MRAPTPPRHRATRRLVAAAGVCAVAVVAAVLAHPNTPAAGAATVHDADVTHTHAAGSVQALDGHAHSHNDPATKNSVSRSAPVTTAETADPTTPAQAGAHRRYAAAQRRQADPRLGHVTIEARHTASPKNRYNMFNACYGVASSRSGKWLDGTTFSAGSLTGASPLFFKPSALGRYLLYSTRRTFLDAGGATPAYAAEPGPTGDWVATMPRKGYFRLGVPGHGYLTEGRGGAATLSPTGTLLRLRMRSGCAAFPEVSTNVSGRPFSGVSRTQEVRGFIDAHTHGMAFEFLGGDVHCGRPWSPYGVTVALRDCPDHEATGGKGAAMEAFLSGKPTHDPVGWPTFKDWPAPESLTHEGTYYKWMERSWRAGQRVLVNLLVENNKLCELYPLKRNSCDDMDSVRLQAKDMHLLEQYVDAQSGGPGRGWYRIVTSPEQARRVINAGKLAVVMGIETSVPFGCTDKLGVPACSAAQIDRQLDQVKAMGVSQMELVNKFDNALSGVAGDEGSTGYLVNSANTLETGSPWRMQTCSPNDPEEHDRDQDNSVPVDSSSIPAQDALFGAVAKFSGVSLPAIPAYGAKHHCNAMGLTGLGDHTIRGMAERHMLFDPDHMSVKARQASLALIEKLHYGGLLSSHSWSTPDAYARIYRDHGFVTPYAGDSAGFVAKWRRHLTWANPQDYWGIGFGADINGLGAQGDPRPNASSNPVTYPFTTLGGVTVRQQVSGRRVYDINKDGVSHYGLYPDWIQDLRKQAGPAIVKDMSRGPEAYLQMWERAYGVRPNSCRSGHRLTPRQFRTRVHRGMSDWAALRALGQPDRRLGRSYTYCSTGARMTVELSSAGKVLRVRRS